MANAAMEEQEIMNAANAFWKDYTPQSLEQLESLKQYYNSEVGKAFSEGHPVDTILASTRIINAKNIRDSFDSIFQLQSSFVNHDKEFDRDNFDAYREQIYDARAQLAFFLSQVFNPQDKKEFELGTEKLVERVIESWTQASMFYYSPERDGDYITYSLKAITPHLPQEYVNGLLRLETEYSGINPEYVPKTKIAAATSEMIRQMQLGHGRQV